MDEVDVLVVGAGVVGLAVARALAERGLAVVIAEAAATIGSGTSSRNSEVLHAGIHYPQGSLKARLCVRGRALLAEYCTAHGVDWRPCGKLVVAARETDLDRLDAVRAHAAACGVNSLQPLTRARMVALEPELDGVAALWSPDSGIVDSHGLMTALLGDAEAAGALLALATHVEAAARDGASWLFRSRGAGGEAFEMKAGWIVNCAGLHAQALARRMAGFPAAAIPPRHLAKGNYFALARRAPFSRLIYPTPVDGGLGTHLTIDLAGQARFGPDVQWLPPLPDDVEPDYAVDPSRAAAFEADIRRWWPRLPAGALQPAYSGVRPKLGGPGTPAADFRIDGPATHGVPGVVQLYGIESPGLTASLAIAEVVSELVAG